MSFPSKAAFYRDLARRVKAQFWLKAIGVPAFMVLFFWGYIYILKHAYFPVTVMPLTLIDRLIPYQDSAWLLYVSLWIYVQLPITMTDSRRQLVLYGVSSTVVSLIGFAFFVFWPTAVPPPGAIDANSLFAGIRSIDTTGNSCPSLHVAFSVFTAVWLERFLRKAGQANWARYLNVIWCLGIIYSTLGTKQHVMLDAYAGTVLGLGGALLQARLENKSYGDAPVPPALAQIKPAVRKL
jgi:membrane-associated phospholipid phosphatase